MKCKYLLFLLCGFISSIAFAGYTKPDVKVNPPCDVGIVKIEVGSLPATVILSLCMPDVPQYFPADAKKQNEVTALKLFNTSSLTSSGENWRCCYQGRNFDNRLPNKFPRKGYLPPPFKPVILS